MYSPFRPPQINCGGERAPAVGLWRGLSARPRPIHPRFWPQVDLAFRRIWLPGCRWRYRYVKASGDLRAVPLYPGLLAGTPDGLWGLHKAD